MSDLENKVDNLIINSSENSYEQILEENEDLAEIIGGMEIFDQIFSIPDDQFLTLENDLFQIFEETFNEKSTKAEIALLISDGRITKEQLELETLELYAAIDGIEDLSQRKKNFFKRVLTLLTNTVSNLSGLNIVQIPCELSENVNLPQYANEGDAGLDIYSPAEYTIAPGETVIIPTGIKVAIPKGYAILIQPRSGQSVKTKLRIANTPGLIDSGYRDEIGVIVENIEPQFKDIDYEFDSEGNIQINSIEHGKAYTIAEGQRFAQMRLVQVPTASFVQVESVKDIGEDRGGGFGHTGQ